LRLTATIPERNAAASPSRQKAALGVDENGWLPAGAQVGPSEVLGHWLRTFKSYPDKVLSKSADSSLGASPVPSYEFYTALRNAPNANWEAIRGSGAAIWGTPERCIERIAELERRYGSTTLLCWTRVGSIDDRKIRDSMGRMQQQVIPYFKRRAA
jgi:alkanesulfonate monooxygenase SsuD/methylene tetrahydromethanopterin reductase-like flavin-dependent oxidoreductase (luciferase family)